MDKNNTRLICWPCTIYALFLYLIYADIDEIEKTLFILHHKDFPHGLSQKLRNCYVYKDPIQTGLFFIDVLLRRLQFLKTLPKVRKNDKIYAQDHKNYILEYIFNHEYVLIEDSAKHCYYMMESNKSLWGQEIRNKIDNIENGRQTLGAKFYRKFFCPLDGRMFGYNKKATKVLLSVDDPSSYLESKKKIILPTLDLSLWQSFSKKKQQRILEIFGLTNNDILLLKSVDYVILTQPLYPDLVSVEEHRRIYTAIIHQYDAKKVLLKIHPRDKFDYKRISDDILIFNKQVPVELFNLIGINFKKVITVFSSSVNQFSCDIDWYGSEFSREIFKKIGHVCPPKSAIIKKMRI